MDSMYRTKFPQSSLCPFLNAPETLVFPGTTLYNTEYVYVEGSDGFPCW